MDKNTKEIIATLALVVVFVIAGANAVKAVKKKGLKQTPIVAASTAGVNSTISAISRQEKEEASGGKPLKWGRDPFSGRVYAGGQEEGGLNLVGIMFDKNNPAAIINDEIVEVGDKVNGNKIIEITKDRVILNDGGRNIELKLGQ